MTTPMGNRDMDRTPHRGHVTGRKILAFFILTSPAISSNERGVRNRLATLNARRHPAIGRLVSSITEAGVSRR